MIDVKVGLIHRFLSIKGILITWLFSTSLNTFSASFPYNLEGTVSVDGNMTHFVAENLEYKIKIASPVTKVGNVFIFTSCNFYFGVQNYHHIIYRHQHKLCEKFD